MDLYLETFDVAELVRGVVGTIEPLIAKNGNALAVDCPGDLGTMHADLTKVRQALFNLLSNAAKFTDRGTITLRAAIERAEDRGWVVLTVRDSGIGMTPDQLKRLFQPFTQADASTTRKYGGTGLGLTITRRFCQMMGGDIIVESESGRGSAFTIRLPAEARNDVADSDPSEAVDDAPASEASTPDAPPDLGDTVLVIDDDPTVRDLMRRALKKDGFQVAYAAGGEEGLRLAREIRPAAITLDVMMPGMDGWAVLEALKSSPDVAEIPVVMVTIVDDKNLGYALGASDYLTKPIDRKRLTTVLKKYRRTCTDCRALVVDDDAATRQMVRHSLEADGWVVSEAEDGRVGLERVAEATPDLIVLDLMMPGMDGFGFAQELRRREAWRTIPILVLTAKDVTAEDRIRLNGHILGVVRKDAYSRGRLLDEIRREVVDRVRKRSARPADVQGLG
ncbi:response regulator [Paludisphaera mucosa]|uniref:histidine kinase n=1 Tax=Paludisphaera mucosa TaxID=3030827 RepID=A0ABT6FE83_9BACT|nr:response regulator [Paludisphaera mucosa]MDG3005880.1 response regulator [Paludisphaera mucosa]